MGGEERKEESWREKKSKQEKGLLGSKRETREHESMERKNLRKTMKVHKAKHLVSNFPFVLLKLLNLSNGEQFVMEAVAWQPSWVKRKNISIF